MFEKIINKLKNKKNELQSSTSHTPLEHTEPFEILLSKDNNFYKMEINDYISIIDYTERMRIIDNYGIDDLISSSVSWNNSKQKINKGTYFIIPIDNRLYNILINENFLIIDERTRKNDITEERIIRLENNDYWCTIFHHDITGSTFYVRYYNTCGFSVGKLDLTKEEVIEEFSSVIENLKNIIGIEQIIDLNTLKCTKIR